MKVLVIGAGTMGSTHSQAYAHMPGVELVGIVDIRLEAAEALAQSLGTWAYTRLEDVLAAEDPQVVDVCVPTHLHKAYVLQAAALGKQVVCEKPLARTLADAREMIDACTAAGVGLYVGQVVRFFPEYQQAQRMVREGQLGRVGTTRLTRGGGYPNGWNDWYSQVGSSGSLVVDLMIHDFDFVRWCFGDVQRVYGKSLLGRETNRLDHAFASLRCKNGVIAHVSGTWAYPEGFGTSLEIAGMEGMVQYSSTDGPSVHTLVRAQKAGEKGVAIPASPLVKSPYYLELEHFIDCIRTGASPVVTAADAYAALEISLAVLASIQTGQPIDVEMWRKQQAEGLVEGRKTDGLIFSAKAQQVGGEQR